MVTCANACGTCTNGRGWFVEEVPDADTGTLVLWDRRCECRGTVCSACEVGAACLVTGRAAEPRGSAHFWDNGAEDFERFDD